MSRVFQWKYTTVTWSIEGKRKKHKVNRNPFIPRKSFYSRIKVESFYSTFILSGNSDSSLYTWVPAILFPSQPWTAVWTFWLPSFFIQKALLFYATTTCCPIPTTQKLFSPFQKEVIWLQTHDRKIFKGVWTVI